MTEYSRTVYVLIGERTNAADLQLLTALVGTRRT